MSDECNMAPLTFTWKNKRPEQFGLFLYDLPTITASNEDMTQTSVPGMVGALVAPQGTRGNITITLTLSVLNKRGRVAYRDLSRWLRGSG